MTHRKCASAPWRDFEVTVQWPVHRFTVASLKVCIGVSAGDWCVMCPSVGRRCIVASGIRCIGASTRLGARVQRYVYIYADSACTHTSRCIGGNLVYRVSAGAPASAYVSWREVVLPSTSVGVQIFFGTSSHRPGIGVSVQLRRAITQSSPLNIRLRMSWFRVLKCSLADFSGEYASNSCLQANLSRNLWGLAGISYAFSPTHLNTLSATRLKPRRSRCPPKRLPSGLVSSDARSVASRNWRTPRRIPHFCKLSSARYCDCLDPDSCADLEGRYPLKVPRH